jgi:hypothetical protein
VKEFEKEIKKQKQEQKLPISKLPEKTQRNPS